MPSKRRTIYTSSSDDDSSDERGSHSSIGAPGRTSALRGPNKLLKSRPAHLFNVSSKWVKERSIEQEETNPVASTSTQLQRELGIIVTEEIEESASEGHQLNPEKRRSKRVSSMVSKEIEKYYEGCLVMGQIDDGTIWPGMIRKPDEGPTHHCISSNHDKYLWEEDGTFYFYVQFFNERTSCKRLTPSNLRLFNAAIEPRKLYYEGPPARLSRAKGVKIAKAASKFSVEDRLRKFTLRGGTPIGNLLKQIDEWNHQHNSVALGEDEPAPSTQINRRICTDSVSQDEDEPAPSTQGNGRSYLDSVASMKKRMSDYKQKLQEKFNLEKEEVIKGLTADKAKLTEENKKLKSTVKKQAKEIVELRDKLEKEKQEKLEFKEETEKIKVAFDEMFGDEMTEDVTST